MGAAYVGGELDPLEAWVRSLRLQTVVGFLDFSLNGGLIKGEKLIGFFRSHFVDRDIRELARPFGAVATDLQRGREVWLREGRVSDAVRASIALPGLFTPVQVDGRWLIDGGLVNPVPVSLCRAMGADIVIAVDLNTDRLGHHLKPKPAKAPRKHTAAEPETLADAVMVRIQPGMSQLGINHETGPRIPAMLNVVASSINIAGTDHAQPAGGRPARRDGGAAARGSGIDGVSPRQRRHRSRSACCRGRHAATAGAAGRRQRQLKRRITTWRRTAPACARDPAA
ncbi:patatin-like phospholipase family protein [Thiobacillus denitrificans]|uniref:patatin-like phospholipase family protein n=1 Tax=Thiobacillus denitrificans TaxID=36861 RepID=UPI000B31539B|nr:patatin-like phospholipase family protein [Thiobacillus denitrificans]